jgi:hypothetical protein
MPAGLARKRIHHRDTEAQRSNPKPRQGGVAAIAAKRGQVWGKRMAASAFFRPLPLFSAKCLGQGAAKPWAEKNEKG